MRVRTSGSIVHGSASRSVTESHILLSLDAEITLMPCFFGLGIVLVMVQTASSL